MHTRFPARYGLLGAVTTAAPCLWLPWILPPPPAVQAAVMVLLAIQGYAAAELLRTLWRRLGNRSGINHPGAPAPGRSAPSRRLAITAALGLLVAVCLPAPVHSPVLLLAGGTGAISWDSLGTEGQKFIAAGRSREKVVPLAGSPAFEPVRAYVGLRSARTVEQRARLAVTELERHGGLTRSTILVVVPTGSGWVNPAAVTALEYLTSGNLATITMQYAELPSWAEYLLGPGRAEESAIALVSAMRQRLAEIPSQHRPRLLLYGESLGAIAAHSVAPWADQALLAGKPGAAWHHHDQYRTLLHADDPVGRWSPRLLFQRPDGWPGGWLPVVSFWQVTGSLLTALDVPAGHGHHYGTELVDAWQGSGLDGLWFGDGVRPVNGPLGIGQPGGATPGSATAPTQ